MPKSTHPHTVAAFDQELNRLDEMLVHQFELVHGMIHDAMISVSHFDVDLAQEVIARDAKVDDLDLVIEEDSIKILALRSPLADDLRWVIAIQKASSELERMGDFSKNISKRVGVLALHPLPEAAGGLKVMGLMVLEQLDRMRQAWIEEKTEQAMTVWQGDEAVDTLYDGMFRELLTHMMESPRNISSCIHLLFIAKNLERIGDHITNIAEDLYYRINGEKPTMNRPKADKTCQVTAHPEKKPEG
ncbi:MAG: Phosphate transport system regulatory protein PhoU [Magnetococcales bacterium]|nr:Phosphate transport system regulatory protein PhoU [Magnetococcales bacterium]HIJ85430.1 phosphate signaling complex protein PhoU [Magnetococcales bacterium]